MWHLLNLHACNQKLCLSYLDICQPISLAWENHIRTASKKRLCHEGPRPEAYFPNSYTPFRPHDWLSLLLLLLPPSPFSSTLDWKLGEVFTILSPELCSIVQPIIGGWKMWIEWIALVPDPSLCLHFYGSLASPLWYNIFCNFVY